MRELAEICGCRGVIPQSCVLRGPHPITPRWPIATRGRYDVYEGFHNSSKVSVQRLRIYSNDREERAKRVRCRGHCPLSPCLTNFTAILPGGCAVETPRAPKHRSPDRRYCQPVSSPLGLDDWRRIVGIHQRAPASRPAQYRELWPYRPRKMRLPHNNRYPTLLTALGTFTLAV